MIFNKLKASKSVEEVHTLLDGIYVKKELTVEDLMRTEYGIAEPEMNLKELTDLFYTNKTSYLPVISGSGEFLGEVRVNDLISVGIPDYAVSIGNLSFMKSFAPLEKLLIEEESIPVRNIMKKSLVSLVPESSVIEAVMKMTQGNFRHLPVIKDGKLAGILNVMDILYKVLRR
jgi:CBS domain-containing protein